MNDDDRKNFFDDGAEADMGFGRRLRFYPISWGAQRRLREQLRIVFGGGSAVDTTNPQWQDAVSDVLYASATRFDKSLTKEDFDDLLDTRNATACFKALAAATGRRADTEASGEPRPTASPSGAGSTATSSAPPAGP